MKILLLHALLLLLIFTVKIVSAQERRVTGNVKDEEGLTQPGVNVSIKGTSVGVITDAEGNYAITVPSSEAIIKFSAIGFKTKEEVVGERSIVDVLLQSDVTELNEVVVTAYGIEKTKNSLGFAAQKIGSEDLVRTRDVNVVNSLSGKVAGVQIQKNNSMGGSTNILIRGSKSLYNNNQPLFVIDGVPVDNSTNNARDQDSGYGGYDYGNAGADINSDDIETLNVLKGAAATVLYGSRAANGVVFITTKKARKGLGITINTGVTVGQPDKSTLPQYQDEYGAGYGKEYGEDGESWFQDGDVNGDGVSDQYVPTTEDASFGARFDPNLYVYHWDAFDPSSPYYKQARPWVAAPSPISFLETSVSNNNNIALDGANDKGFFKVNYTRNEDKGIMPNSRLVKNYVNLAASHKITDKISITAAVNFSDIRAKGRYYTGYGDKNPMASIRQWWQRNVDMGEQKEAYFRTGKNVTWNWANPLQSTRPIYWDNPYWVRYENYEEDSRTRFLSYLKADYKVNKWLSLMGRYSLDTYNERREERIAVGSLNPSSYSRFERSYKERNLDAIASVNTDIVKNLVNFSGQLGTNLRRTIIQSIYAVTNNGLVVPNVYALSNTRNPIQPPVETFSDIAVDGYFLSTTFSFKKLLFLDLAGRLDRFSTLPKTSNTAVYGSAALSFVFTELFKSNLPVWLTGGKLRLNYAQVGNGAPFNAIQSIYTKPTAFGNIPLFSTPLTANNPNLKPERTKNYEVGLEMTFFDARLGFDATFYHSNTVDQLIPISVSRATGYYRNYINAGNMQNQGIEASLYVTPVKTRNFSWDITLNFTRNRNRVLEIYRDRDGSGKEIEIQNIQLASFVASGALVGQLSQPYGLIIGTDYIYNKNGEKLINRVGDDSKDGYYKITETSNNPIGNINPNWIGGIQNTLSYKNVSLTFLIDIKSGGSVFSVDMYYGLASGLYKETAGLNDLGNPLRDPVSEGGGVLFPGVLPDGQSNFIRVPVQIGTLGYIKNPMRAFVYDASYVKLRELSLTYAFPSSFMAKIAPLRSIELSLMGRNLWIIHKNLPYADPEDSFGAGNVQGVQAGSYPNVRTVGFNLKVTF